MSFQHTKLPPFVISDLYKEGLILIDSDISNATSVLPKEKPKKATKVQVSDTRDDATKATAGNTKKTQWYLGDNKKKVCILVKDENAVYLQEDMLEFLSSILNACKLNLADVAIINILQHTIDHQTLNKELSPKTVLMFEVKTADIELPFSIPDYKVQQYTQCTYIQFAALDKVKADKMEKSKVWLCLKELMNV
jgi:hypothetical protein